MEINEILESLKAGKISTTSAKKLLSLYSIEEVEEFAKIDINRRKRRGIPEIIYPLRCDFIVPIWTPSPGGLRLVQITASHETHLC